MRISLTRAVAGVAIAATAVLTAAGAASATTASHKTPTNLSIVAVKSKITAGQWDTVKGTLKEGNVPLAHKIIILDVWVPRHRRWRPVEEKFTGKAGNVAFPVRPRVTVRYRLAYHGNARYVASHSATATVVVLPFKIRTALSIAASATTIKAGSADKIRGALSTAVKSIPLRHQWVWLAVVVKGEAHPVKAFLTGRFGRVSFTVKPKVTTTYELLFRGNRRLAAAASGAVTVTVTP